MNDANWVRAVIDHRQEMKPLPTTVEPRLQKLPSVRAVVFDVYGTLVVSGSGDVGSADATDTGMFIGEAIAATGNSIPADSRIPSITDLQQQIQRSNQRRRSEVCPKPEVDIVDVWRRTLQHAGLNDYAADTKTVVTLAAEYESRANPTWPMPGATDLLRSLADNRMPLGIVSNAQVFTVSLVEDLLGTSLAAGRFDLDLCVFSNRFRQAKPGPRLFDVLREGLKRRGIAAHEAIYVGNDMLNDVWAASQAGLKTAWFAGDGRSARRREDDPRCRLLDSDLVITELLQLLDCLQMG